MKLRELTRTLITVSEKAATLARTVRSEEALFQLLVEEKDELEKNQVFVRDFKTLTDVLVQELVKHDITKTFPELDPSVIHGEESNKFTNTLGQSITISIQDTREQTGTLLERVLDGNQSAAALLAEVVHRDMQQPISDELTNVEKEISADDVSIWIDPIDSTFQYIRGKVGISDSIYRDGLQCVSVLIGVYHSKSGAPIVGVVNQPFCKLEGDRWAGRCVWGISYDSLNLVSANVTDNSDVTSASDDVIVMSLSDKEAVREKMMQNFDARFASGAGYKLLCIKDSLACAYVQSIGVTYRWDTCAPHGLLRAQHGGIVPYSQILAKTEHLVQSDGSKLFTSLSEEKQSEFRQIVESSQIVYHESSVGASPDHPWQNVGGIVAYDCLENLYRVLYALKN